MQVTIDGLDGDVRHDPAALIEMVPYAEGKVAREGRATAYVCERFVCQLPTTDPEVFAEQLEGSGER